MLEEDAAGVPGVSPWVYFNRLIGDSLGEACEALCQWARAICTAKRKRAAQAMKSAAELGLEQADRDLERYQSCWTRSCQGVKEIEAHLEEIPAYLRFNYKPKCVAETDAAGGKGVVPKWAMWPAPLVTS